MENADHGFTLNKNLQLHECFIRMATKKIIWWLLTCSSPLSKGNKHVSNHHITFFLIQFITGNQVYTKQEHMTNEKKSYNKISLAKLAFFSSLYGVIINTIGKLSK